MLDARTYKNCHAVGIPNSGHKTGVLWALNLASLLTTATTQRLGTLSAICGASNAAGIVGAACGPWARRAREAGWVGHGGLRATSVGSVSPW